MYVHHIFTHLLKYIYLTTKCVVSCDIIFFNWNITSYTINILGQCYYAPSLHVMILHSW